MPKGKVAETHKWDNEYLTVNQIAEKIKLSPQSVYRLVQMGCDNSKEALSIVTPKPRRSRAEIIASLPKVVAVRPKPETRPIPKVNENAIVRVQDERLHLMLEYLAKRAKVPYQTAFNAFICYIGKGNVWGKFSEEKIIALIAGENSEDLLGEDAYSFEHGEKPLTGWQQKLIPYLEELEAENADLKEWKARKLKQWRGMLDE